MFGIFKKRTKLDQLQDQYQSLMAEWHALSQTNRSASDAKYAEAEKVLMEIEILKKG